MTALESVLRQAAADLVSARVRFALVGGLAVSVRTEPRFTRDADLAVAVVDDAEAESLVHHLRDRGYTISTLIEQEAVNRLATVRLSLSHDPRATVVDLLFASSGVENEIVQAAEALEVLPGLTIHVAFTGHLIALKVLSRDDVRRAQDLVDLRALLSAASEDEIDRARQALTLITARGYHRNRHLLAALEALLVDYPRTP